MVEGEGAQKQRTHTPRQENAHIDTLWEQEEGRGGRKFRGLGSKCFHLHCRVRPADVEQGMDPKRSNNARFVDSI